MSSRPAVLALLLLTSSCLPESGPGLGQRVLEGRGLATLGASPADPGGQRALFFSRNIPGVEAPGSSWNTRALGARELFVVRPGSAQADRLISRYAADEPLRFDARGRLLVVTRPEPVQGRPRVRHALIDLASGAVIDLGLALRAASLSPGGTQLHYSDDQGKLVVRTSSDIEQRLTGPHGGATFAGETLYASDAGSLWQIEPDGSAPRALAADVSRHQLIQRPEQPPGFVLVQVGGMCSTAEARYFRPDDPAAARPLGPLLDSFAITVSPDGRRLVLVEPRPRNDEVALRVVTLEPPAERRFVIPVSTSRGPYLDEPPLANIPGCPPRHPNVVKLAFRPASEEIWVLTPGHLTVVGPDERMDTQRGSFYSFGRFHRPQGQTLSFVYGAEAALPVEETEPFSADGRRWVYREAGGRLRLADADPPRTTSVLPPLEGQEMRAVAELPESGSVVVFSSSGQGVDLQLYDAGLSIRRATIRDVRHVAFGRQRLLTIDHGAARDELYSPGVLALLEIEDARQVPVAANVTEFLPLASCASCDPLAAGAPLAYLVHARVPWKYDGLWTANLP